jgi:Tol biopolymer transport system component
VVGFIRVANENEKRHVSFVLVPSIGGPERMVADLADSVGSFSWFPDSKWVVTSGLTLLSTESGETRSLTSSPAGSFPDSTPAVSPDGRTVAFERFLGFGVEQICLLDLTEDLKPKGQPRQLTSKDFSYEPAWTADGQEIIFVSGSGGSGVGLWRIPASGGGEAEPLAFAQGQVFEPAVSRKGNRLAYVQGSPMPDDDVWRLMLSGPGTAVGPPARFIASTRSDSAAQYSPDGKRIAFESDSGGVRSIWVCDAAGTKMMEVFSRAGTACGTAHWSPDGQRIAFDSNLEGNFDIYVIRSSGGKPIRLTNDPAADFAPSWSRDGRWVYFESERSGRMEVWKVPAGGGEAIRVTRNGGGPAQESPDGRSIYYTKGDFEPAGLWKMPVEGGKESQVLPSLFWRAFCVVADGIYFMPKPDKEGKSSIQFLSFAAGKVKTVTSISGWLREGLSVSPDGRSLLFSQTETRTAVETADLMLVENFR